MRGEMSKNPCEALGKMRIRVTPTSPRWFANLRLDMVTVGTRNPMESMFEISRVKTISKRRYGMEATGNPQLFGAG